MPTSNKEFRTIYDDVSGNPIRIDQPLLADHVRVGVLLWYQGQNSIGEQWSCPAVIVDINKTKKRFLICSLDGKREEWYDSSLQEDSPFQRQTMKHVDLAKVRNFVNQHKEQLDDMVSNAKRNLTYAKTYVSSYKRALKKLDKFL
jgi:hypothetical protein